mmetsp:Transcript_2534/g.4708  ORF Transcript_2534/g.4708 Transcript_2534/m.4708 type:complete len:111 (+) Transcript_2534:1009-1341(+)
MVARQNRCSPSLGPPPPQAPVMSANEWVEIVVPLPCLLQSEHEGVKLLFLVGCVFVMGHAMSHGCDGGAAQGAHRAGADSTCHRLPAGAKIATLRHPVASRDTIVAGTQR